MNSSLSSNQAHRRVQKGLTLIEMCVVVALATVVVASVIPSWRGMMERRTLEGRASELVSDVYYARSESVSKGIGIRMSFATAGTAACYIIHTGTADDCTCQPMSGQAQCTAGGQAIKTVALPADGSVRLNTNVRSMLFHPAHGTTTPAGTLQLSDSRNRGVNHIVNIMGRVRSCSPGASMPGYPRCV